MSELPMCQAKPRCPNAASVAIQTKRPTRANLWTKVWWEESQAPKDAERLCGDHAQRTLADLARVLA